ncbi:MAG TPA: hypothetical protein VKO83_04805 [Steroidobacteraceae bacterium]|nr:hypothetical protein [Steroidobacteraceae bacterium]
MNPFSLPRFRRLFINDVLRVSRPVLLMSAALLCLTTIVYLANLRPGNIPDSPPMSSVLFGIYLLGGGLLLTSEIFRDMHHPLERYHYLMLPVSNAERFLSRYLLTGPLLVLYLLVAFAVMDWVGNQLAGWLKGASAPPFSPGHLPITILLRVYLFVHLIGFLGAICFRSMSLAKTALAVVVAGISMGAAGYLAMRIFYFDAFEWGSFQAVKPIHMPLVPLFEAAWMNWTIALASAAWLLYVAYRCLKAHEVQNGL